MRLLEVIGSGRGFSLFKFTSRFVRWGGGDRRRTGFD